MVLAAGVFGLGAPELLIVLAVLILIFGASRLADLGGSLGKSIREFKKNVNDDDEAEAPAPTPMASSAPAPVTAAPAATPAPVEGGQPETVSAIRCPSCGTLNAAGSRHCSQCGTAIA